MPDKLQTFRRELLTQCGCAGAFAGDGRRARPDVQTAGSGETRKRWRKSAKCWSRPPYGNARSQGERFPAASFNGQMARAVVHHSQQHAHACTHKTRAHKTVQVEAINAAAGCVRCANLALEGPFLEERLRFVHTALPSDHPKGETSDCSASRHTSEDMSLRLLEYEKRMLEVVCVCARARRQSRACVCVLR